MREVVVGSESVTVGNLIGKGGEGKVFSLNGRSGAAVKIYNSRLRSEREEKVRAMVYGGFAAQTHLVAYPREIVSDRRGNFLGFLMHRVSGYLPIHELYSPKSRQRHFAKADYRFLVRTALNISRAVGRVHQTGCVIGDLNHSGVLVSQDARVALIDADSFQFSLGQKIYPCVVGVPDFLPPELHGVNLATAVRTTDHDNFGLAVAIFLLLFMGRHPYAGRHEGPDLPIGQAIKQNRFAYSLVRRSLTGTTPPPGALTLDVFPALIRDAFESAFDLNPNVRPTASSWIMALKKLEGSLNRCSNLKTHFYPNSAGVCLWCELARDGGGLDMFPDLSGFASDVRAGTHATEQAIREIQALQFPMVADLLPKSIVSTRKASRRLREAKRAKRNQTLMGLIMLAGAGAGFFYAATVWFVWVGLAIWAVVRVGDRKVDPKPFQDALNRADEALQREIDEFVCRNGLGEVAQVRGDLSLAISSYRSIDEGLSEELRKLNSTREARQRTAYLDQYSIQGAKISGIGPVRTTTLISFGIETAADISQSAVVQVPGFGAAMAANLVEWRRKLESRFRYNSARTAQDVADENKLRASFGRRRATLEATIRNGLKTLRTARPKISTLSMRVRKDDELLRVFVNRLQAEQDLKVLGVSNSNTGIEAREVFQPQTGRQRPKASHGQRVGPGRSGVSQSIPRCPQCAAPMRRRSGRFGVFWGCSRYPACNGSRTI